MPFKIIRNDITRIPVDAIVNTASAVPGYGSGVDAAVYLAAGESELLKARKTIGYLAEGEVAVTPGFRLTAKYIIHAVSPRYIDGEHGEEQLLRSCYKRSMELARKNGCTSIAFPLIATGNFGYPKEEGMRVAVDEIKAFLLKNDMLVYLVVFDKEATLLGSNLGTALQSYIDETYVELKLQAEYHVPLFAQQIRCERMFSQSMPMPEPEQKISEECRQRSGNKTKGFRKKLVRKAPADVTVCPEEVDYSAFLEENQTALKERMKHRADTFQEYLMYLIESRGLTNAEVYKRSIITKQLFSKIKLNPEYHPDKATAMRLCVGARLNMDETRDLLARAGYALSPCDKRDIIFSFFIEHNVYDMIEIDIALEEHGLPCFIE